MNTRDLDPRRLLRASLQVALVLAGAASCNASTPPKPPQAPGVAEMQGRQEPAVFQLWAPAGTRYTWTERRNFDASLVGTDVANRDQSELTWDMSVQRQASSDATGTVIDGRLVRASFNHDGRTVVAGAPDATIRLVLDPGGTLESIQGLEGASRAVRALAARDMAPLADRLFSADALRTLLRARVQLLVGDLVGRPTGDGSTWIATQRRGDDAMFTRYTVMGTRPCDASPDGAPSECTQVRVWVDVQPRAAEALASALVEKYTGQPVRAIPPGSEQRRARYVMWGTLEVQPATLLPSAARLEEAGHLDMLSGGKTYRVQVRATTEDRFEYLPKNVAMR